MKTGLWNRVLWLVPIAPFCCFGGQSSATVSYHTIAGANYTVYCKASACGGSGYVSFGSTSLPAGTGSITFSISDPSGNHSMIGEASAGHCGNIDSSCFDPGSGGTYSFSYDETGCANSFTGVTNNYEGCVCATNTGTGPVTPIGAAYPSQPCPGGSQLPTGSPIASQVGPLTYPGQPFCFCYTNNGPFTMVILMPVLDQGGFSDNYTVDCSQAGTNNPTSVGGNGNGTPATTNGNAVANAPNSGWGNNTNLTGQQYASGVSNTIAAIVGEGTALGNSLNGNLGSIGATLKTISGQLGPTNSGSSSGSNVWIVGSNGSTNALPYTNLFAGTNGSLSQGLTNMWGSGSNMLMVLTNALGGAPSLPTGSPSALSFAFCGYTLNFDPEVLFPGLPALIRAILGWGAAIWFGIWFGGRIWSLTGVYSRAELGGVPDLDAQVQGLSFGVGGNAAGVAVALIIPIVFIAIWVGVFTVVIGWGLSVVGGSNWTVNPFSQMNSFSSAGSAGLYLLEDLTPLSFLLSLVWTRLGCEFGMSLLVAAASSVSRYLFGK